MENKDTPLAVPETELRILWFLYQGYEDARVARVMGLSHRTVQRHVKKLMDRAGVASRLALGARAQELGWLGPRPCAAQRRGLRSVA
ncbi:LuxR C-terminal-related transcriptional regulator [Streptomyces sp. NPDC006632]|uniref:LuxR C-terminal-related transcriptional regulator n=1 Tax=unclassified Streptomyces TaxID=2593676 RepID=UPI002E212E3B